MLSAAKHLSQGKEPDLSLRSERSSPVMLSAAKHLFAQRASPFAQFPLSEAHGFSMTIEVSSTRDTKRKQHEAPADEALLRLYHD